MTLFLTSLRNAAKHMKTSNCPNKGIVINRLNRKWERKDPPSETLFHHERGENLQVEKH
jgi:hypothetical protein